MELFQLLVVTTIDGPGLTAVSLGAKDHGSVRGNLGGQFYAVFIPESLV